MALEFGRVRRHLQISKGTHDLALPIDAVTETFAILGRRGSGKTHTAVVMAEEMFTAGVQIGVLDPLDVWWGLRAPKVVGQAGLPIYVAGGAHGDLPLLADAGKVLADVIVDSHISMVLSLRHLSKSDQRRFVGDFCERLYDRKGSDEHRTPLHLFIDEADAFVPQRLVPGSERCFGAVDTLVRRGRSSGLAPTLISQRPQVINKDVLSQTEVMICHQLTGPQDRKALQTWTDAHDPDNSASTFMNSLASLQRGECWVWSPGMLNVFKRVTIRDRMTFDSSATPKPGSSVRGGSVMFAPVDVRALTKQIQATVEQAKADDPKELKKTIADLRRQIESTLKTSGIPLSSKVIEKPVLTDAHLRQAQELLDRFDKAVSRASDVLTKPVSAVKVSIDALTAAVKTVKQPVLPLSASVSFARNRPINGVLPPSGKTRSVAVGVELPTGERAVLIAAAQYPDGLTREQATILTGYKRSTRDAYIQRLMGRGFIEVRGSSIVVMPVGIEALGSDYEPLPTGVALQDYWLQRLPSGEGAVLHYALGTYPDGISRSEIGDCTGFKRSTRDAYIQRLTTRKLVVADQGSVRASDVFFDG